MDLPPATDAIVAPIEINVTCLASAAAYYNVPPELIIAVRIQEGGTVGRVSKNTNGSKDIGPMQINTIHLGMFRSWGISGRDLLNNECTNIFAGTYILHREIASAGDIWRGIGNYHSRTPTFHNRYRKQILSRLLGLKRQYGPYLAYVRQRANAMRAEYLSTGKLGKLTEVSGKEP